MSAIDYAEQLQEANKRLAALLAEQDRQRVRLLARALATNYSEYRYLEKDYPEYTEEMSLGGTTYKEPR
jgi:hypothetical protein